MKSFVNAVLVSLSIFTLSSSVFAGSPVNSPVQEGGGGGGGRGEAAETQVYFKCPSTSPALDAKSLMSNDGDFYSIAYAVNEVEAKGLTESCSFIVTPGKSFTEDSKVYLADLGQAEFAAAGEFYGLIPAKTNPDAGLEEIPSFDVHYDYASPYAVYFNLEKLEFFITPLIFVD